MRSRAPKTAGPFGSYAHEVWRADSRLRPYIRETYLEQAGYLSNLGHARVYLKMEHLQYTGSFKVRGAFNKILSMSRDELKRGIVTASNGNHGLAVCFAAQAVGVSPTVYLRESVSPERLKLIKKLGGRIKL